MNEMTSWTFIPTGAIPTLKNNNPDKKISNNADNNNPEIPVNCGYFVGNYFNCWELHNYVFLKSLFAIYIALLYN